MKHLLKLQDWSTEEIMNTLNLAERREDGRRAEFEPTEWVKDERQGQARDSGRSPCNNKKLNGARGTGDRTKAMR